LLPWIQNQSKLESLNFWAEQDPEEESPKSKLFSFQENKQINVILSAMSKVQSELEMFSNSWRAREKPEDLDDARISYLIYAEIK